MTGSILKSDTVSKQVDEIEDNVRRIENSIRKESDYDSAKSEIANLTEQENTDGAFETFNTLINNYGDLGAREDLRELMKQVSVKETELVKPAGIQLVGQQDDFDSIITSQVVVARRDGNAIGGLQGETLPVLTEGVLYGLSLIHI